MSVNSSALKHIRQSAKKSQTRVGGKTFNIPVGNLVLLCNHPEGHNKIQDNYKSKLFVVVDQHKVHNVYIIQSLNKKGPKEQSKGNSCLTWKSVWRIQLHQMPVSRDLSLFQIKDH